MARVESPNRAGDDSNIVIRIPFGERDGRMRAPDEVANGAACGCVCPECGGALIAYQRGQKRPHFGHYHDVQCDGAGETALHRMAKQIFAEATRFAVPEWPIVRSAKVGSHRAVESVSIQGGVMEPTARRVEPMCDGLRPDVIIEDAQRALWLEVRVTHPLYEAKRAEIKRRGLRCIEIDLRNHRLVDKAELQRILEDEFEHKRWIAHPERERAAKRAQARAVAEARRKAAEERRYLRDQRKRRQQVEENRRARRRLIRNVFAHLPEADHGIVLPATSAALESC